MVIVIIILIFSNSNRLIFKVIVLVIYYIDLGGISNSNILIYQGNSISNILHRLRRY